MGDTGRMGIKRMENMGVVVQDLDAAVAFFVELGMELEGKATVEGEFPDSVVGLEGIRCDIAMVRTPDGDGRLELMRFQSPDAVDGMPGAPANALGFRRILFSVEDIDATVAHMLDHGAQLMGEVGRYEETYKMCYLRGPEEIIIALAEKLT